MLFCMNSCLTVEKTATGSDYTVNRSLVFSKLKLMYTKDSERCQTFPV